MKKISVYVIFIMFIFLISSCDFDSPTEDLSTVKSNFIKDFNYKADIFNEDYYYLIGKYGNGYLFTYYYVFPGYDDYHNETIELKIDETSIKCHYTTHFVFYVDGVCMELNVAYNKGYLIKKDLLDIKDKIASFEDYKVTTDFDLSPVNKYARRCIHDFSPWMTKEKATCTSMGKMSSKCIHCKKKFNGFTYSTEHTYKDGKCIECSYVEPIFIEEDEVVTKSVKEDFFKRQNYVFNFISGVIDNNKKIYLYEGFMPNEQFSLRSVNFEDIYFFYTTSYSLFVYIDGELYNLMSSDAKKILNKETLRYLNKGYSLNNSFDNYMYNNYDELVNIYKDTLKFNRDYYEHFNLNYNRDFLRLMDVAYMTSNNFLTLLDANYDVFITEYIPNHNLLYMDSDIIVFDSGFENVGYLNYGQETYNLNLAGCSFKISKYSNYYVYDGKEIITLEQAFKNGVVKEEVIKNINDLLN